MTEHLPLILVEGLLVFGGVLAFAVWQLRDVKRAQAASAARRKAARSQDAASGLEDGGPPAPP